MPLRQLFSLAWPIIISRSSQVVVGMADALMVATLGEAALAAVTTGAVNTFTLFILPMGLVFIVSSFASQLYGKGDLAAARRYAWYGIGVAALTQLFAVGSTTALPTLLALLPYEQSVYELMLSYMVIRLWSGGAAIGLEALANYYGALDNTRLPMVANLIAMVLNIFANWVLIFGNLGAPALGVVGAAWASLLSTILAFAFLLIIFILGYGLPGGRAAPTPLRWSEFRQMLRFGLPSGLNWFFEMLAFVWFINIVVSSLGTTALAALMAVMQLSHFAFMPSFGMMSAGAILVGQAIGADNRAGVRPIVHLTLGVTFAWQALVSLSYLLFPQLLLSGFATPQSGTDFIMLAAMLLYMAAAWQLFDAAAGTYAEMLRAAGDTDYTLKARLIISWLIFVPGSYLTARFLTDDVVTIAAWLVFYLALLAFVLWRRFESGAWKKIELTEDAKPL